MEYNIDARYNENCEYKSSQVRESLPIISESQDIALSVVSDKNEIDIGESCILTVTCIYNQIPVKIGYITINESKIKCTLNDEGQAKIQYTPQDLGVNNIKVTYHDDTQIFNTTSTSIDITTVPIFTQTKIITDVIAANLEESVTITAKVSLSNGDPLTYGRVTFLHYYDYTKDLQTNRIEKIIGNPVYLDENGEASITYIPMQSYEDDNDDNISITEDDFYVEYIVAHYNYEKDSSRPSDNKSHKWEYYKDSHDEAYIYMKQPNTIYIEGYKKYNNVVSKIEDIKDYRNYMEAKNQVILKASIHDDDDIRFKEGDTVVIFMHGTVNTGSQNNFTEIDQSYLATYVFDDNLSKGAFETSPIDLAPGFYDFYVQTNVKYSAYDEDNTTSAPKIKILDAIEESVHYYLQVDYNQSNNITMSIDISSLNVQVGQSFSIDVHVNNLTEEQKNLLKQQECYLYISSLPPQSGTFSLGPNDDLYATFNDIALNKVKNYVIYAHTEAIKEGNEYIPPLYSNNVNVFAIGDPQPSIEVETVSNIYPGSIKYTATIEGIEGKIIEGNIYNYKDANNKGDPIKTIIFDEFDTTYTYTLPDLLNDDEEYIEPGEYTLEMDIEGISNPVTAEYEIFEASLSHKNSDLLKYPIYGIPLQQASIVLYSNSNNLTNINTENIRVYTKKHNEEWKIGEQKIKDKRDIINTTLTLDNSNMIVTFLINAYTEEQWDIKFEYNDDGLFKSVDSIGDNITTFETYLLTPSFEIYEDEDNNFTISINNPQSEYIPLIVELTDARHNDYLKFIAITDVDGKVTITAPEDKTIWNILNMINITVDPTNEELINALLDDDATPSSIIYDSDFEDTVFYGEKNVDIDIESIFDDGEDPEEPDESTNSENQTEEPIVDDNEVVNDDESYDSEDDSDNPENALTIDDDVEILTQEQIIFNGLRNQLDDYGNTYLFTLYKKSTFKQIRGA